MTFVRHTMRRHPATGSATFTSIRTGTTVPALRL
jgi:hypothetical protein